MVKFWDGGYFAKFLHSTIFPVFQNKDKTSNHVHIWQVSPELNCGNTCQIWIWFDYYASAFRRWRHYVFGLPVRPSFRLSVQSLKYPLLTCTWVRWSTRPTITVLRHVRPEPHRRITELHRRITINILGIFWTSYFYLSYLLHKQGDVQLDEVTPVAGGLTLHSCYCN